MIIVRRKAFCWLIVFLFFACRKTIPAPLSTQNPTTFDEVFEDFWLNMNINYLYWDVDTTNWDAVRDHYRPLFAKLDLQSQEDASTSVVYLRKICDGLIDRHFLVTFNNPFVGDSVISPAYDRDSKMPGFHNVFSYLPLDATHLDSGYVYGFDNTTSPGNPLIALSGTIDRDILFFACNQFGLNASFQSHTGNSIQTLLRSFFDRLQHLSVIRGILLDVRGNPGGDVSDLSFFAGHFADKPFQFGYTRYKSGNGRLDYTPWINAEIVPQAGATQVSVPIVILADRNSASVAELFTMAMRVLPNCRIVGETTFGATGPLTENAIYNDGSFSIPGFMSVETSSAEFRYIDSKIYEGKGFSPDYPVPFDATALSAGRDPQMDMALSLFQ